jgi:hypothetical protein
VSLDWLDMGGPISVRAEMGANAVRVYGSRDPIEKLEEGVQ